MKKIWIGLVRLCGWKFHIPSMAERPEIKHCVLIMAPHTCIADFFVGAAVMFKAGTNPRIFMKKEFFNWFCGPSYDITESSPWTAVTQKTIWYNWQWTC